MTEEAKQHVHNALMETMIGAFCMAVILGTMLGFEYTVNGNAFIPPAYAQSNDTVVSIVDSQDSYMSCDCVGPNIQ